MNLRKGVIWLLVTITLLSISACNTVIGAGDSNKTTNTSSSLPVSPAHASQEANLAPENTKKPSFQRWKSPVSVDLSISKLPVLNEPAELTLTLTPSRDAPNSIAQILLPKGAELVRGDLDWQGNLTAGTLVSYSVEIVFNQAGKWTITATGRHEGQDVYQWGEMDAIHINVGVDHSEFGWEPEPGIAIQASPGDGVMLPNERAAKSTWPDMRGVPSPPSKILPKSPTP
jgi:predicted small secreted protein